MVEKARRSRVDDDGRGARTPQWEVFCRDEETDPLRHVGSVAAPTVEAAYEHASRLFGWYAVDLWLCPADAVERYSTRPLDEEGDDADRTRGRPDGADPDADEPADEPRVYEETEGTPSVRDA